MFQNDREKTSEIPRFYGNSVKMWSALSHGRSNELSKQQGDCEGMTGVRGPSQTAGVVFSEKGEARVIHIYIPA